MKALKKWIQILYKYLRKNKNKNEIFITHNRFLFIKNYIVISNIYYYFYKYYTIIFLLKSMVHFKIMIMKTKLLVFTLFF